MKDEEERGTVILGVGNLLCGDDGLGVQVAERLAAQRLPPSVRVEEGGTSGLGLAVMLEGYRRAIIVDAIRMGQPPGTWRRFGPEEVRLIANGGLLSLHEPEVANALALAQAVDVLPDEVLFFGVEPADCEWGHGLSPAVEEALPELVENILVEVWKTKP